MYIPRPAKLLFQIDDGWNRLLINRGHPHIHLSVTRGGLCRKHGVWRSVFFKKKVVERYWRQAVIALLRQHYASLDLAAAGYRHIRDYREWCQFLESQYQRRWKIHFAKKTKHARQNVNYLGRYLKRPPVAASKLRHYNGGTVVGVSLEIGNYCTFSVLFDHHHP